MDNINNTNFRITQSLIQQAKEKYKSGCVICLDRNILVSAHNLQFLIFSGHVWASSDSQYVQLYNGCKWAKNIPQPIIKGGPDLTILKCIKHLKDEGVIELNCGERTILNEIQKWLEQK